MTGSQGESQSRGSLAARTGKDKIEEVAKNVEEILKTFRPSWRNDLQYQFCWKTNTPKKKFSSSFVAAKVPAGARTVYRGKQNWWGKFHPHFVLCQFYFRPEKILPFLFSGVRLSELPIWENGDSERTEKDIFDFQEEEEDGDAPRNGKYTLKSVKKIDHYSRLEIIGENVWNHNLKEDLRWHLHHFCLVLLHPLPCYRGSPVHRPHGIKNMSVFQPTPDISRKQSWLDIVFLENLEARHSDFRIIQL